MSAREVCELIARNVEHDERWIAKAEVLIEPDCDCSAIEKAVARARRDVARMRQLLA